MLAPSTSFKRYGDKQNSEFFEDYLVRLLEERDRVGLTGRLRNFLQRTTAIRCEARLASVRFSPRRDTI